MPSRSSRRLKKLPHDDAAVASAASRRASRSQPPSGSGGQREDDVEQEAHAASHGTSSEPVAGDRTPASPSAERAAFEPPQPQRDYASSTRSRREESPEGRAIQVQIRGTPSSSGEALADELFARSTSSPTHHGAAAAAASSAGTHASRAAFAPPVVTRSTRRETYASAFPRPSKHASGRKREGASGRSLMHPSQNLSSSSGSFSGEDDSAMLDLFSPPKPSSMRTRPRPPQQHVMVDDLTATVTKSTSVEEVAFPAAAEPSRREHQYHDHYPGEGYGTPPTVYTPHTTVARRREHAGGERAAYSTSQKQRVYEGRVVHVPKSRGEGSAGEEEEEEEGAPGGRSAPSEAAGQRSAPARLPVSRQAMASDRGDVSSAHQGGIEYDSQDDHMDAALQLSFEDSPRNSLRDDDGNPSPSKKPRTPPPARSRASQPHSSDDDDDEEQHDQHRRRADQHATPSRQQQQQQQFPPYHPGYPYPYAHPGAGSPGYPPYPPHGFPPPGYPAHQWPGYYYPQYQQHQQAQRHPDLSSSEERHRRDQQQREQEPAGSQTPAKRKGSKTNDERDAGDVTMDTAELSYEESMVDAGPLSPPSSKKKRDASRGAAAAWGSPPREYTRSSTEREADATPQRGSAVASRKRHGGEQATATPSSGFLQGMTPSSALFGEYGSPGGAEQLFAAGSWSPSHMQAFFEEEVTGTGHGNNNVSCSSGPDYQSFMHEDAPVKHEEEEPFSSALSPTRGGITIRGSPITRKTDRGADLDEAAARAAAAAAASEAYRRGEKLAHSTPARDPESSPAKASSTWQTPSTGMRIKIGNVGVDTSEARRGIEGINSVLRGSPVSAPPKKTPSHSMPVEYVAPTPIAYGSSAAVAGYASAQVPETPSSAMMMTPAASARRGGVGKENSANDGRNLGPCTCKNSKCLKLYCICFAAEQYCYGCKCANCQNTPQFDSIRNKAIADTKAKNPKAFKNKTSETTHSTGCKCKKSACLKKYCECFQGGIVCGQKCKCVGCKNFVGSQALIDRRRKIRDVRGAQVAMSSAEKAWKSETKVMRSGGPPPWAESPVVHEPSRLAPGAMMLSPPPAFGASPYHQHPPAHPLAIPGMPPGMMQQSPMMYGIPPHHHHAPYPVASAEDFAREHKQKKKSSGSRKQPSKIEGQRTHSFQRRLDAQLRKERSEIKEPIAKYFGPDVKGQTKRTALSVFSYLENDDLFNASIVSKMWCDVAFDQSLWRQSPSGGTTRTH